MNKEKIAFLFAGQGAQYVGMGKDLYENNLAAREVFDKGAEILDFDIKDLIFNGPEDKLRETKYAQMAILLTSLGALKALESNGIEGEYATGLSLGEYGALIYGGALTLEDGLRLVKERGRIMGSALPKGVGKMAAIMKLSRDDIKVLLEKASEYGICEGANYNCPGQVVIAGDNEAIDKAIEIAKELGGRGILLNVSGPFHSSLLKEASEEFYKHLSETNIENTNKMVYSNVKGALYKDEDDIKLLLKNHIRSSVYFEETIKDMLSRGVTTFVEIGPGKVLSGFVKKIDRNVTVLNVEDMTSLENTINTLKSI